MSATATAAAATAATTTTTISVFVQAAYFRKITPKVSQRRFMDWRCYIFYRPDALPVTQPTVSE